jgi:hypothetical protein
MDHGQRAAHELSRFWDTLIQDETTVAPLSGLETELTVTVRWLHRHRPGAAPDAVRERIWQRLAHQASHDAPVMEPGATPALLTPIGSAPSANGRRVTPHALGQEARIVPSFGHRARTQLATAALLLVTLAIAFVALRPQIPEVRDESTRVPALIGALESVPGDVVDELLLEATFSAAELPAGDVEAVFYRLTLPPGASLPYLAGPLCKCSGEMAEVGAGVEVIESGAYTLRLDAPMRIQRDGASQAAVEIPAQAEVILGPGDTAIYPDNTVPGAIGNGGDEPVVVIGVTIHGMEGSGVRAPRLPTGVRLERLSHTISSEWRSLPAGPVSVSVWRLMLPEETGVGPYEATGLESLWIESGGIMRSFLRPGETEPRGRPLFHPAGTSAPFMAPAPGVRRIITSTGDQPAVLLALSIEPAGAWSRTLAP